MKCQTLKGTAKEWKTAKHWLFVPKRCHVRQNGCGLASESKVYPIFSGHGDKIVEVFELEIKWKK